MSAQLATWLYSLRSKHCRQPSCVRVPAHKVHSLHAIESQLKTDRADPKGRESRLVITRYTNLTIRVPANRMMSPSDRRVHRSAALALGRHRLYVIDTGLCEAPSIVESLSARVMYRVVHPIYIYLYIYPPVRPQRLLWPALARQRGAARLQGEPVPLQQVMRRHTQTPRPGVVVQHHWARGE